MCRWVRVWVCFAGSRKLCGAGGVGIECESELRFIMTNLLSDKLSGMILALVCLGLVGCRSHKSVVTLGGGYVEVTHSKHALVGESELARTSFEHRGAGDKTLLIWPSLYGVNETIKGDLAIFVGDKSYVESGEKVSHPRLFAVQSPELPLDITDAVLWYWSKSAGRDFAKTLNRFSLVTPEEKNGRLELQLDFWAEDKDWPDRAVLQLDWSQVSAIMNAVKKKGVVEKDLQWHTAYIGEEY